MERKSDEDYELERWRSIVKHYAISADGHRLVTHGAHTGHMIKTVALCETAIIATALAEALARQRED